MLLPLINVFSSPSTVRFNKPLSSSSLEAGGVSVFSVGLRFDVKKLFGGKGRAEQF